jgi:hypothetical protein
VTEVPRGQDGPHSLLGETESRWPFPKRLQMRFTFRVGQLAIVGTFRCSLVDLCCRRRPCGNVEEEPDGWSQREIAFQ